jgi:hypothetical protein
MTVRRGSAIAIIICGTLLLMIITLAWRASLTRSPTVDEPGSLVAAWVQFHFHDWRGDVENPALWQTLIAVGLPGDLFHIDRSSAAWHSLLRNADEQAPIACRALYESPGVDPDALMRWAHLRMTIFGALLGIVVAWWAWRLRGAVAGVCALAVFCFDPTILAHSPMLKNDVPLALAGALFAASVWLLGERATIFRAICVWFFMSCAIMMKFSGVVAIFALAIALVVRSMIREPWPVGSLVLQTVRKRLAFSGAVFVGALLFAWVFVWACYSFQFAAAPNSSEQYDFESTLQSLARHQAFAASSNPFNASPAEIDQFVRNWRPGLSARVVLFANAHRLLPQSFLIGLLRTQAFAAAREGYLCGQSSVTGWWYYFPLAFVFKTPVATLVGLALAIMVMFARLRRVKVASSWRIWAAVNFPGIYLLVSMGSNVNVGIRHILPVYPFVFIFLGVAAAGAWNTAKRRGFLVVLILLGGLVVETLAFYPNYIQFFNVVWGGPRGGIRFLSDSNLDWGQDLPALAAWQSEHRDRALYLAYWGSADPRHYGITYVNLPGSTAAADLSAPGPGKPAYAIGAAILTNRFERKSHGDFLDLLVRRPPIAVLNGSIYIFDPP